MKAIASPDSTHGRAALGSAAGKIGGGEVPRERAHDTFDGIFFDAASAAWRLNKIPSPSGFSLFRGGGANYTCGYLRNPTRPTHGILRPCQGLPIAQSKARNRGRGKSYAWSPCKQHEWTMEEDDIWCAHEDCTASPHTHGSEYEFSQHCLLHHGLPTPSCRFDPL
jgi:hypothetical protein